MRNIFFILALFVGCKQARIYSQQYVPFPMANATWQEYNFLFPGGPPGTASVQRHTIMGDTYVMGNLYHYLETHTHWHGWDAYEIIYAIREFNKKIYRIDFTNLGQEELLYDFENLQIGDTVDTWYGGYGRRVMSIDSIQLANENFYRKRFGIEGYNNINNSDTVWVIEGMGSVQGLGKSFEDFESYSELMCFSMNGNILYQNDFPNDLVQLQNGSNCDELFTSVDYQHNDLVNARPNPSKRVFHLENINSPAGGRLEVYNLTGELLLASPIEGSSFDLNLEDFPPAIYWARWNTNGGAQMIKLMKF